MNETEINYILNLTRFKIRYEFFGSIVCDLKSWRYSLFNETATDMLMQFKNPYTTEKAAESLIEIYEESYEKVLFDVKSFVYQCLDRGILTIEITDSIIKCSKMQVPQEQKEIKYLSAPIEISINPHYACNQKCTFCYAKHEITNSSDIKQNYKMSYNDYVSFLKSDGWNNVFSVNIVGGEPLLDAESTFKLLDLLNDNFLISLSTNGTAQPGKEKEIISKLSKYNMEISVSLQSSNPAIHDSITGLHSSYDTCIRFLKEATKKCERLVVRSVVIKENINDLFELAKLAKEIGASGFAALYPMPIYGMSYNNYLQQRIVLNKFDSIMKKIKKLDDSSFFTMVIHDETTGSLTLKNDLPSIQSGFEIFKGCSAGNRTLEISETGNVMPCCILTGIDDYSIGNVLHNSFDEIWHNTKLSEFRNYVSNTTRKNACANCEKQWLCFSGCPLYNILFKNEMKCMIADN